MGRSLEPKTFHDLADALAVAGADGHAVRIRGAGTKIDWGSPGIEPQLELRTTALDAIVEHNVGDLTAVLEAGVPLARAQRAFASADQMLALDPALGLGARRDATVGGVIATGDSGPLRHRYGAPRDLVLGATVALSDGTIARSGGKVIKNVAGYDLGKLFCGSFGTLGVILQVSVRLHPLPVDTVTALGSATDVDAIAAASSRLAAAPLELEALDVAWRGGRGGVLAQLRGAGAGLRAERIAQAMRSAGLDQIEIETADSELWARQRAGQRSQGGAIIRVSSPPSALAGVLHAAEHCAGTVVGRAALGVSFIDLSPEVVGRLREQLPEGATSVLLDAPAELRRQLEPWGTCSAKALDLMRRVKAQFDPARACNPGIYVGGI